MSLIAWIAPFIILLVLVSQLFSLIRKNGVLRKENVKLLKKADAYDALRSEVKEMLKTSTEMQTIKTLRADKGLSLVDAKKVVDSVKGK